MASSFLLFVVVGLSSILQIESEDPIVFPDYSTTTKGPIDPTTTTTKAQPKQCGPNEEHRKCGCPREPSCFDKNVTCDKSSECVSGCFCKDGFLRSFNNECIEEEKCFICPDGQDYISCGPNCYTTCIAQPKCGPNEEYRKCGTSHQPTCSYYQPTCDENTKCVSGCFCKEGFLRSSTNECILEEECRSCPANETFFSCGPYALLQCGPRLEPPTYYSGCLSMCICKPGYMYSYEAGRSACILPQDCVWGR